MADEEAIPIELAPPGESRIGQVRAIYFDECTGYATLTIDEVDAAFGNLPR
jgi:hypothetical protein